jgi:hypothetical protein
MAKWEATRPSSFTTNYATIVGCGSIFDVQSSAPDQTTCCSFTANSTGANKIVLNNWGSRNFTPDSYYTLGVRVGVKSMGTMYLNFDYSVNSGLNWTTFVSSWGSTSARSDTLTCSIAATQNPASLWLRVGATTTHSRGRVAIWDVFIVGSYSETYSRTIADNVGATDSAYWMKQMFRTVVDNAGVSDYSASSKWSSTAWTDVTGDSLGVSDSANRMMTIVRGIES